MLKKLVAMVFVLLSAAPLRAEDSIFIDSPAAGVVAGVSAGVAAGVSVVAAGVSVGLLSFLQDPKVKNKAKTKRPKIEFFI